MMNLEKLAGDLEAQAALLTETAATLRKLGSAPLSELLHSSAAPAAAATPGKPVNGRKPHRFALRHLKIMEFSETERDLIRESYWNHRRMGLRHDRARVLTADEFSASPRQVSFMALRGPKPADFASIPEGK